MGVLDEYEVGELRIRIIFESSDMASHPGVGVGTPEGFRVIGGGARVDWQGAGNMLTGIFPENDRFWRARSKDHNIQSEAIVTGFCICAQMKNGTPISNDNYIIRQEESVPAHHPSAEVVLPDGFILVGGGAASHFSGPGSLLYASHPGGGNSWIAAAKDHVSPEITRVTAYAIGVKQSFLTQAGVTITRAEQTGTQDAHPRGTSSLPHGFRLLSGGARVNLNLNTGNLLTASFPLDRHTWEGRGKDHQVGNPSTLSSWSIGVVAN